MPQPSKETTNALLITFSPKTNCTQKTLVKTINYYIDNVFIHFIEGTDDFKLYPELNANGNIHWHGYVIPNRYWYRVLLRTKAYGFVKINKVRDNLMKAMEYCKKDVSQMLTILPKRYVPTTPDTLHKIRRRNIIDYFNEYEARRCTWENIPDLAFIPVHDDLELIGDLDGGVSPLPEDLTEDSVSETDEESEGVLTD